MGFAAAAVMMAVVVAAGEFAAAGLGIVGSSRTLNLADRKAGIPPRVATTRKEAMEREAMAVERLCNETLEDF